MGDRKHLIRPHVEALPSLYCDESAQREALIMSLASTTPVSVFYINTVDDPVCVFLSSAHQVLLLYPLPSITRAGPKFPNQYHQAGLVKALRTYFLLLQWSSTLVSSPLASLVASSSHRLSRLRPCPCTALSYPLSRREYSGPFNFTLRSDNFFF